MNVKIWDGIRKDSQLKTPIITVIKENNAIKTICVDENGEGLCSLIEIDKNGFVTTNVSKQALEKYGYDTSFTSWDRNGAIEKRD